MRSGDPTGSRWLSRRVIYGIADERAYTLRHAYWRAGTVSPFDVRPLRRIGTTGDLKHGHSLRSSNASTSSRSTPSSSKVACRKSP